MARKKIDAPIEGMTTDWEGYTGGRVQDFIKAQIQGKAGEFYYDSANNRYMVFADADAREKYLADRVAGASLLLGVFDAPFNYTASIALLSPTYCALLKGDTPAALRFTFDVVNKSGQSVGEDVNVTYTLTRGATKYSKTERLRYGSTAEFDPSAWIDAGTSTLTIAICGLNTLAATTVAVTYQVIDLSLTDQADISKTVTASAVSAPLEVAYTLSGYGVKTMEWYIDGQKQDEVKVEDEITQTSATRTKTLSLINLAAGTHSVQYRARTEVDGQAFYSPILYREVMVVSDGLTEPLTAVAITLPSSSQVVQPTDVLALNGLVQYQEASLQYAAYNPSGRPLEVSITLGETLLSRASVSNGTLHTATFTPTQAGAQSLTISAEGTSRTISAPVEPSSTALREISNNLLLAVDAKGRSNADVNKDKWNYGSIVGTLSGMSWNALSGWTPGGALAIPPGASVSWPITPLSEDVTTSGLTLEVELAASGVSDDNAVLLDLLSEDGKGLRITASQALLTSNIDNAASTASVRFKSGENVRLAFVIRRRSGETFAKTASVYIDGIHSASFGYGNSASPFVCSKQLSIAPSTGAGAVVRSLRLYNISLSDDELLNNYELYRPSAQEMLSIYRRNAILAEGSDELDPQALLSATPVMIITGDVPAIEATQNKKATVTADIEYTDVQDSSRCFTIKDAVLGGQGTSSMLYPRKNFRIWTQKADATKVYDSTGTLVPSRLISFHGNAQPVNCWCLKADYAESSGTHNTGIARIWNDVLRDARVEVDGQPTYPLRTGAQKAAIAADYPYDVRTAIDGFPITMFYRLTENSPLIFLGKYNFNNDKSTESVFGFRDVPGFDSSRVQCWECLDNAHHLALMKDYNATDWPSEWSAAFEGRYPDGNQNTTDLQTLVSFVSSSLQPTLASFSEHFDVPKLLAYYIYAMRHGAVDQLVKNSMLTTEDGEHWYFIHYDNDTTHGLDNDGIVAFGPDIDRQSKDPRVSSSYCYAGHESRLWNVLETALEQDEEMLNLLKTIDQALYTAGLKYKSVIKVFEDEQSSKWSERVYNRDAQYKYLLPWLDGIDHLPKLQGSRKTHRRWWLSKRFSLYDSRWVTGDYRANVATFKCYDAPAGTQFSIESGRDVYFGFGINNVVKASGIRLGYGQSHTFTVEDALPIGNPVVIYAAPDLRGINLSAFYPWLADVSVQGAYTEDLGTSLTSLVLGTETFSGTVQQTLTAVSGLSALTSLEYLDLRNLRGISSLDLSNLYSLKTALLQGTNLSALEFAEGAPLQRIGVPATCTSLVLHGHSALQAANIDFVAVAALRELTITGCPLVSSSWEWLRDWLDAAPSAAQLSADVDEVRWSGVDPAFFIKVCERKSGGSSINLRGRVNLSTSSQELIDAINAAFGPEVFSSDNELYINAPDAIYISGPDSVLEGDSAQYSAAVFSENRGRIIFSIYSGSRTGTALSADEGVLTTTENGYSTATITIRATHIPTQGTPVTVEKDVQIQRKVYPSNVTINGPANLIQEENRFSWSTTDAGVNGAVRSEWEVSGDAADLVSVSSQSENGCVITKNSDSAEPVNGVLTLKLYSVPLNVLKKTVTKQFVVSNPNIILTKTSNPQVMDVMYSNGLCANENYMTRAEAALVSSVQFNSGTTASTSIFNGKSISSFDELEYFTGLTEIPPYCFPSAAMTSVKLPPNITSIRANSFNHARLTALEIPEGVTTIGNSAFSVCYLTSLSMPSTLTTIGAGAFLCAQLTGDLVFPASMVSIGSQAFQSSPITGLSLPDSVTSIGSSAFMNSNLQEFTLPASCNKLSQNAVGGQDCVINLHANVNSIETCPWSVKRINIASGSRYFKNRGGIITTIANSIITIPKYLDQDELIIPSNISFGSYGGDAFSSLFNVKKITFGTDPFSVVDSSYLNGDDGFSNTPNLEEIAITDTVSSSLKIVDGCLYSIDGTKLWLIPNKETLTVPDDVTFIHKCYNRNIGELTIPKTYTGILFFNGFAGRKVTLRLPYSNYDQTSYGNTLLNSFAASSTLEELDLSDCEAAQYWGTFQNCTALRRLVLPEGVTYFSNCDGLSSLEYIDLPSTMAYIPKISDCPLLCTIICRKTTPLTGKTNAELIDYNHNNYPGKNVTGVKVLYVPANSTGYESTYPWSSLLEVGFTLSKTL